MPSRQRKTFTKILPQQHPDASLYVFTPEHKSQPDDHDHAIAREIVDIVERGSAFFEKGDGEWKYVDTKKRNRYITSLAQRQYETFPDTFANIFRNDASYGLVTPSYIDADENQTKNQILVDLDTCVEFTHLSNVEVLLFDPAWGNPFGLVLQNGVIAPDTPRHYYFAKAIKDLSADSGQRSVVEIGGGYGGLALMFRRLRGPGAYLIVDLFETCLIQYYFLRRSGVAVEFVLAADQAVNGDKVYLIPTAIGPDVMRKLGDIGVVFNSRSFSEMSRATVDAYFATIQTCIKPKFVYHENSNFLLFPNSERHIEVLGQDFPIDPGMYRLLHMGVSPFLGGGQVPRVFV